MIPIDDQVSSFKTISKDLEVLSDWAKQWLVTFNASKSVYIIFSLKRTTPDFPPLEFNGSLLERVQSHTHLGITFNSKMTWNDHINRTSTKAFRVLNMMKRIKHLIPYPCMPYY